MSHPKFGRMGWKEGKKEGEKSSFEEDCLSFQGGFVSGLEIAWTVFILLGRVKIVSICIILYYSVSICIKNASFCVNFSGNTILNITKL